MELQKPRRANGTHRTLSLVSTMSIALRGKNSLNKRKLKVLLQKSREGGIKLHVGCGGVLMKDWVNADIEGEPDIYLDVTKRSPFPDESVSLVYSEHLIEHLAVEEGLRCFAEFRRILALGGTVRIATPDLDYVVEKYLGDWKNQDWLTWKEYSAIATRAEMVNVAFRGWGHKYLYNEEELNRRLCESGFKRVRRVKWGESEIAELRNLETRPDSRLIVEARKL